MFVLTCIALSAACDSPTATETSANTEVELLITDATTPPEELLLLIDFVSYRITCPMSGLTPYDDSVDIAGNFEVVANATPPVWQLATSLPLSDCTISLWVFYEDEVVCQGSDVLPIVEDDNPLAPNKVNILLECTLSVDGPSGNVDIDGNFQFVHGNYCPKLNWLSAIPPVVAPAVPPVTSIETLSFDPDNTCGLNCDPQTCDFNQIPPVCTPGPDPGLTSTLFAPAGNGTFGDPNAAATTYTCDPLVPGPTEICVRVSDGDTDCDQLRCMTIICPDLCEGASCDDGNECTADACDPLSGACTNDVAPDGIACDDCNSTCQGGVCDPSARYIADYNSNFMSIVGNLQPFTQTLVNPYSGQTFSFNGPIPPQLRINSASYKGVSSNDILVGSALGDALFVQDPLGTQRICGVEIIQALAGFDVLFLADTFVVLQDMLIYGGDTNDLIWANAGNDTVFGNNGVDLIDGGPGDDIIDGGQGNDTITLWPGSGFDSIYGGINVDTVQIDALQSQLLIVPAADASFEFDIFYLGVPMAQIIEVESIVTNDGVIDLTTCTAGVCALCGNDALNGGEECDDGNNLSGDGCAADCTAEY